MDCKLEQGANIKVCDKLGKSATETFDMIRHMYGNEAMIRARCFEWHARFKSGGTSLDDDKKIWKQFGDPLTTLLPSLMCRTEQCKQS